MTGPTLVFLHALGASAREWMPLLEHLPNHEHLMLDIPGYGAAADAGYADVGAMADWLADVIRGHKLTSCILVGHSMGGKIVTLVAARAAAGESGLSAVVGVVLVAASPPAPEPMDEARRAEMIGWFADGPPSHTDAAAFIDANSAAPVGGPTRDTAIADVLRTNRQAWLGWLERGSREDWRAEAGRITIPALILAGADDGDLGADAQRRLNLPHYANADLLIVEDAAHLIPYEQPARLAALIEGHAARLAASMLPTDFARLLGSDRVSRRTRAALVDRMQPPPHPGPWTAVERQTVAALVGQILPDCGADEELADRILANIAAGGGDGWRFAALPPDREAWRRGIATLNDLTDAFAGLDSDAQRRLLDEIAAGRIRDADDDATLLSPQQMALWFEDVRAETVRLWMSLPATMALIGYDGFAVGGDGPRKQGYTRTHADDREEWQPRSALRA